jgi:ATP-dependent Clp protease ATP-binding subunit ClpA
VALPGPCRTHRRGPGAPQGADSAGGAGSAKHAHQRRRLEAPGRAAQTARGGAVSGFRQVGKSEHQSQGLATFLRPYLARGDLLAVAECTPEQVTVIERQDPHLLRAFTTPRVEEPDPIRTRFILDAFARDALGRGRRVLDEALDSVLRLHRRYATYSASPGRPLRFLRNLLADHPADRPVTASDVTAAFARETGLPLFLLEDSVNLDLAAAREWFASRVIGQPKPVDLVTDLLATVKAGLNRPRKPIASLLFIGPTGVGKTEMAVEKADPQLFDLLLQVVGEGRLTDSSGRLADFTNSVVIMASNLGAESYLQGEFGLADARSARGEVDRAREHFVCAVRGALRPELFNRIDRIVAFGPLDAETVRQIAARQLDLLRQRDGVRYRGVTLEVGPEVPDWLARVGHDPRYGARPDKRALERRLLAPLAEQMNAYTAETALRVALGWRARRCASTSGPAPTRPAGPRGRADWARPWPRARRGAWGCAATCRGPRPARRPWSWSTTSTGCASTGPTT